MQCPRWQDARLAGLVHLFSIRCSAQAMKSVKVLRLCRYLPFSYLASSK